MSLPTEVLTLIVAHTDANTRHALRAASRGLRNAVDANCKALTLPRTRTCSPAAVLLALQSAAACCNRWGGVRALTLKDLGAECMRPALALLNGAARHCPELSTITLARLDCKLSLALTSCLSSCRLASLTSLALTASNHGESLPLTPVGELSSLTALTVIGRADVASAAWLPPGLRRLRLGALDLEHPGIGGTSWLDAIGACRGLEVLELSWLDGLDLGPEPDHPDDEFDFTKFYSSIGQLTNLRELIGVFYREANGLAEIYSIDGFEAHLLLPKLTALQRLALYTGFEDQMDPAIKGPLSSLAAQCATLEELAFGALPAADDADAALVPCFPRLDGLHITFSQHKSYPPSLRSTFPAVSRLIVGCNASYYGAVVDFDAVASLPCCTSLSIMEAPDMPELSGISDFYGRIDALSRCSTLRHVRLSSLFKAPLEECLELAIAPQIRVLEMHGCTFDDEVSPNALATSLRVVARRREGFSVVVEPRPLSPLPCLLPHDILDG